MSLFSLDLVSTRHNFLTASYFSGFYYLALSGYAFLFFPKMKKPNPPHENIKIKELHPKEFYPLVPQLVDSWMIFYCISINRFIWSNNHIFPFAKIQTKCNLSNFSTKRAIFLYFALLTNSNHLSTISQHHANTHIPSI